MCVSLIYKNIRSRLLCQTPPTVELSVPRDLSKRAWHPLVAEQISDDVDPSDEKSFYEHCRRQGNMLFFSFFKTLVDTNVTVELKNDISIQGTLKSVDQYLNIKLDDITVVDEVKYPHLSSVKNVFIRGSVVRYVHLPGSSVDTALLEDATRREAAQAAAKAKQG